MRMIVIGNIGSDAGYWVLGSDGTWHHEGGWGVESLAEFQAQAQLLAQSARLKTPGLANKVGETLQASVSKLIGEHVKGADENAIIIIGG
jgi:hypothetical protein